MISYFVSNLEHYYDITIGKCVKLQLQALNYRLRE